MLAVSSEQDTAQIVVEDEEMIDDGVYVSKQPLTVPLNVLDVPRKQVGNTD